MPIVVKVVTPEEYTAWVAEQQKKSAQGQPAAVAMAGGSASARQ
jgi:heme/copper-type cytochrome/quinol oxidase subunit 2